MMFYLLNSRLDALMSSTWPKYRHKMCTQSAAIHFAQPWRVFLLRNTIWHLECPVCCQIVNSLSSPLSHSIFVQVCLRCILLFIADSAFLCYFFSFLFYYSELLSLMQLSLTVFPIFSRIEILIDCFKNLYLALCKQFMHFAGFKIVDLMAEFQLDLNENLSLIDVYSLTHNSC